MNLARAFVKPEQAYVAEISFDGRVVGNLSGFLEHLNGAVGGAATGLEREIFVYRRLKRDIATLVTRPCGLQDEWSRRLSVVRIFLDTNA
ncbi:hypothetical protein RB2654_22043 [Rhodobacterales bacterium HTCC2654]|uniref:Uncharacterized protein n=1 Tax=Maritimibacter alkaliphilus HTCC2654 TaxID=314271 RepID=A3VLK7_9RHOB|nr:hypothetical protein RB2654_22043 [Rhodobacterales bacterium HTCC2654] [Maritimibacter alkaliphilus HTCC2654]